MTGPVRGQKGFFSDSPRPIFKGKYRMIVLRKNEGERYTVQICGPGKNMISVKAKREQKKAVSMMRSRSLSSRQTPVRSSFYVFPLGVATDRDGGKKYLNGSYGTDAFEKGAAKENMYGLAIFVLNNCTRKLKTELRLGLF